MIGTVEEMNYILAFIGFVFAGVLMPTLANRHSYVPRNSSFLTAFGLYGISLIFFNLSLWISGLLWDMTMDGVV